MTKKANQAANASIRCWNAKAASILGLAALISIILFIFLRGTISYLSIFILACLICEFLFIFVGITFVAGKISFPCAIFNFFPFLVMGRRRRAVVELDEITYIGKSFGSDWVTLRFGLEHYPVPFASRERRLAFFEAVQAQKPSVRIYRAY